MENGWIPDRHNDYLISAIFQTLQMSSLSLLFGGIGGLTLGIVLYVTRKNGLFQNSLVFTVLNVIINFIRPIPFIILLMAIGQFTQLLVGTMFGTTAAIVPLSLAVMAGFARIVEQNLVTVDAGVIEAARAAGASRLRIIWDVLIPEALGPLILGFTFVFVAIIDMTAVAGVAGAGGLGYMALSYGFNRNNFVVVWVCVGIIIVLVQVVQLLGNRLSRKVLRY